MTEQEPPQGYEIEFFRRADGGEPVRRFLDALSEDKRNALVAALTFVLARQGLDVCRSEWGKQLGGGLAEFRLRHDEREVAAGHGPAEAALPESSAEKILLRVFFHAHGNRLILLLSGYDKGARSSARHQQKEIERARGYLKEWQAEQARRRRANARPPHAAVGAVDSLYDIRHTARMSTRLSDYTEELRSRYDEEQRARLDAEMRRFDLAGQLLSLRQEASMTQQQLAERSGISQADISHYERGLGNPTQKTIAAIAAVFGAHLALVRDGEPVGSTH